jgi:hypothetical protein
MVAMREKEGMRMKNENTWRSHAPVYVKEEEKKCHERRPYLEIKNRAIRGFSLISVKEQSRTPG